MQVQPYLFFDGRCEEAIEFYKKTLGAKVEMVMRFKEAPDQSMMHARQREQGDAPRIKIGDTTRDGRRTAATPASRNSRASR